VCETSKGGRGTEREDRGGAETTTGNKDKNGGKDIREGVQNNSIKTVD